MELEKVILREKSKNRKKNAKNLGRAFLSDLPDKRQQKYLKNSLKLITHLDLLFLLHTSVSKKGLQGEFEDPLYYGLTGTTFYKMVKELQQVGALHCTDNHYEFRKGKSKAGFDYSKSKGCKRKYEVVEGTPYFDKINPGSSRWRALRQLNQNCSINISREVDERIKYPTNCGVLILSSKEREKIEYFERMKIQNLDLRTTPLTNFPLDKKSLGQWSLPSWGQGFSDSTFRYDKNLLHSLCSDLLSKTEESLRNNLNEYIYKLNSSLQERIQQNPAYEGFLRKIEPNCSIKTSRSYTVYLKTSWRASTAFSSCSKKDREKMKRVFGWNTSVDIKSESLQIYSILGEQLDKISNRSFYKKIIQTLKWDENQELLSFYKSKEKMLYSVKESIVRMMSVGQLSRLKTLLCNKKHLFIPSEKYVEELYFFLKTSLGFFDSVNLFYYTSFVEVLTIFNLRNKGIFVENCYDEFYYNSEEISAKEIREELTKSCHLLRDILKNTKDEIEQKVG